MADNKKTSFRISLEEEDVKFMEDYKLEYGGSIQWFVERSVKERIETMRVKQQLNEPLNTN